MARHNLEIEIEQRMNFQLWIETGLKVDLLNAMYISISGHSRVIFYSGPRFPGEPKRAGSKNLEKNLMQIKSETV